MDSITLKNYRCFREEQTARLAPLTLLVGENSTGKTSFLAILRALWDVAFADRVPDFREEPYDLGSFEDIVHNRGVSHADTPDSFEASIVISAPYSEGYAVDFHATFKSYGSAPFPAKRRLRGKEIWVEENVNEKGTTLSIFSIQQNQWEAVDREYDFLYDSDYRLIPIGEIPWSVVQELQNAGYESRLPSGEDIRKLDKLFAFRGKHWFPIKWNTESRPFAIAPVRSRPRRTYDPIRPARDAEGEYIPAYLANLYRGNSDEWQKLKKSLEDFGRKSGLFDDISVMSFGKTSGAPFQIRIRKWGKRRKGVDRNLIDVGYGVSQALPIVTDLLRSDVPQMFLLQQPEVHLHPSAQAALGSLFCAVASQRKQLIVETHSDYIIDRVRMDVRDNTAGLKPDDVSILYFERDDLDVKIHSIRLDEMGNVLDAPPGYRQFFTDEMMRSVGF